MIHDRFARLFQSLETAYCKCQADNQMIYNYHDELFDFAFELDTFVEEFEEDLLGGFNVPDFLSSMTKIEYLDLIKSQLLTLGKLITISENENLPENKMYIHPSLKIDAEFEIDNDFKKSIYFKLSPFVKKQYDTINKTVELINSQLIKKKKPPPEKEYETFDWLCNTEEIKREELDILYDNLIRNNVIDEATKRKTFHEAFSGKKTTMIFEIIWLFRPMDLTYFFKILRESKHPRIHNDTNYNVLVCRNRVFVKEGKEAFNKISGLRDNIINFRGFNPDHTNIKTLDKCLSFIEQ